MRSFFIRTTWIFLVFLIAIAVFIASFPLIVSFDWGRKPVLLLANFFIPGNLEIRSAQLQWGKGQQIVGLSFKDLQGNNKLEIKNLSTDASLWQLLNKKIDLRLIDVRGLSTTIIPDDDASPLVFTNVNANLNISNENDTYAAKMTGKTQAEDYLGSFDLSLLFEKLYVTSWNELVETFLEYLRKGENFEIKIQANNFPVTFIDLCTSIKKPHLKGLFCTLLGDRLNITFRKELSSQGVFNLTADAPNIFAEFNGSLNKDLLTVWEPAILDIDFNPKVISILKPSKYELQSIVPLKILFYHLSLPLAFFYDKTTSSFDEFGFKVEAHVAKNDLLIGRIGTLNIENLEANLESNVGSPDLFISLIGHADFYERPINLNYHRKRNKTKEISSFLKKVIKQ